jgi:heme/copper-type cytochrome/quinol oxidase subunit 3
MNNPSDVNTTIPPGSKPKGYFALPRDNDKLGVWLFLGGEVIFFTTLILTFALFRTHDPAGYAKFKQNLSVPLVGLNTFILIASSYLVVRGLEAIQEDRQQGLIKNFVGVILLGAIFLAGQAYEWISLFSKGIGVKDKFGTPFFTITGIHGTHVLIGLLWAAVLLFVARRNIFSARRNQAVEVFGLYWHFVDIIWIILFTLFYLL